MNYIIVARREGYVDTFLSCKGCRTYRRQKAYCTSSLDDARAERDYFQATYPRFTWTVVPMVGGAT